MSLRGFHNQPSTVNNMERVFIAMTGGAMLAVLLAILAPNPAVAIDCEKDKTHSIVMGTRAQGDRLLFTDQPKVNKELSRTVSASVITGNLAKRISYIEVIDGSTDGKGGCAYIMNGGVGSFYAAIYLESQKDHGLNSTIRVFG